MAGRGTKTDVRRERAIALSPLDPVLYAMQAACGLAYLHLQDFEKAAHWAEKGARAPGAHFLIGAIAAMTQKIKGDDEKAEYWARTVKERRPDASVATFFQAFPFEDAEMRKSMRKALVSVGLKDD